MKDGTRRYLDSVEWLGKLYDYFNDELFNGELVRPVITIQADTKNKYYGWFSVKKVWHEDADDEGAHEINISAQYLKRDVKDIAETLLHEMCHNYAAQNNLQDCSRSGNYHNKLYKKIAEEHGLNVECVQGNGWTDTSLTDDTKELLDLFLQYHKAPFIYRDVAVKPIRVRTSSTRKYTCPCCKMSVRATKDVNLLCGDCHEYMVSEW